MTVTTELPEGLSNFRDVGGLPASGGSIRRGRLFRSDALAALTPAGIDQFRQMGISTIFDLRSRVEMEQTRPMLDESTLADYVSLPLLEGAVHDTVTQVPTLAELYNDLVAEAGESFARIAEWVALRATGGVLVHCTAGKDRTGVSLALILDAVRVPRDDIIVDYVISAENLAGAWSERMLGLVRKMGFEVTPEIEEVVCGTDADAMRAALETVDAEYGGSREYFLSNGLDERTLTALQNSLVENTAPRD
ncbi:tyrosine-protein phosphatase [Paramicrobacterium chengjingii]|uniref:Tyrosine-protein phosphatase n=1 Tax=Paramicrobacterium chengjingii TaxID=2769067 RepID=A0ABX6YL27_9MICO|nr:tyrosine-protein phosphatase [Microbacterium chengjingii]QPZ39453.1 tyrosine-protein phosphatase [Microbacterium chengjingii]